MFFICFSYVEHMFYISSTSLNISFQVFIRKLHLIVEFYSIMWRTYVCYRGHIRENNRFYSKKRTLILANRCSFPKGVCIVMNGKLLKIGGFLGWGSCSQYEQTNKCSIQGVLEV